MTAPAPTPLSALPDTVDLRLVVTDMDGSLLDGEGRLPTRFDAVLARMRDRGVVLVPASGRQLDNLRATFGSAIADSPVIAENGTVVVQGATEIHRDPGAGRAGARRRGRGRHQGPRLRRPR